jgi:hypothetical protein
MKNLVSVLLLSSISLSAHAIDTRKVVGNYKITAGNCGEFDRASISLQRERTGREMLELSLDGAEAEPKTVQFSLASFRTLNPDFPLRSPIVSYVTKVERGVQFLKNTMLREEANARQTVLTERSLQFKDDRLLYRKGVQGSMKTCVLTR